MRNKITEFGIVDSRKKKSNEKTQKKMMRPKYIVLERNSSDQQTGQQFEVYFQTDNHDRI